MQLKTLVDVVIGAWERGLDYKDVKRINPKLRVETFCMDLGDKDFKRTHEWVVQGGDSVHLNAQIFDIDIPAFAREGKAIPIYIKSAHSVPSLHKSMQIGDEFEGVVAIKVKLKRIR